MSKQYNPGINTQIIESTGPSQCKMKKLTTTYLHSELVLDPAEQSQHWKPESCNTFPPFLPPPVYQPHPTSFLFLCLVLAF